MQLQIENSGVCNARCVFCPYPAHLRPRGFMEKYLFQSIIDQAAGIGAIDHITLTGLGEPLLDPQILDRIAYVRRNKQFRAVPIDVYTNGFQLSVEKAQALSAAGLTTLYVSLNAVDSRRREAIMGLKDYDALETVLHEIIAKVPTLRTIVKAVVAKDLFESTDSETFETLWGGRWDFGGNAFLHLEGNWAGACSNVRVPPTSPCVRLFNQIMILWDGRVSLCCFDGKGEKTFGDLNLTPLVEVLANPEFVRYRRAHIEGRRPDLLLCGNCTAI